MSVLVSMKVSGDTDAFQKALAERGSEFKEIGDPARGAGAIHHRFGIADGVLLVIDEWETAEQFHTFLGDRNFKRSSAPSVDLRHPQRSRSPRQSHPRTSSEPLAPRLPLVRGAHRARCAMGQGAAIRG